MTDCAIMDNKIKNLKRELEYKKSMLTINNLSDRSNNNKLLKSVLEDYKQYHTEIIKQSDIIETSLNNILSHLKHIISENSLTGEGLNDNMQQQSNILSEIQIVRNDLEASLNYISLL